MDNFENSVMPTDPMMLKPNKKKSPLRRALTALFVLLCIAVIGVTALHEFGPSGGAERVPFASLNFNYLFFALADFIGVIFAESIKYFIMIRHATGKNMPGLSFTVAVYGKYYDNITPLGSGGQPFQVYHLKRRGVPMGHATAIPIAGFFANQLTFVLLAIVMFIINGNVTDKVGFKITAYVGLLFYILVPVIMALFTIWPKPIGAAIGFVIRLAHKCHLIRNYERAHKHTEVTLSEYRESIIILCHDGLLPVFVMLFSLMYQVLLLSIPFFVLMTFGGKAGWIDTFTMSLFVYAAITCVPTPGNSGAAEGAFYALFSSLGKVNLFWAMLVWRFFSYYLFLLLGLCTIAVGYTKKKIISVRGKNRQ